MSLCIPVFTMHTLNPFIWWNIKHPFHAIHSPHPVSNRPIPLWSSQWCSIVQYKSPFRSCLRFLLQEKLNYEMQLKEFREAILSALSQGLWPLIKSGIMSLSAASWTLHHIEPRFCSFVWDLMNQLRLLIVHSPGSKLITDGTPALHVASHSPCSPFWYCSQSCCWAFLLGK